ncbi:hypothetical protein OC845_001137 [Tilletia horrida]|nr:hypothetical protein OC845_001137 [Tilletia horrida]
MAQVSQSGERSSTQPNERTALLTGTGASSSSSSATNNAQAETVASPSRYQSTGPDAQGKRPSSYIIVTAPTAEHNQIAVLDSVPYRQQASSSPTPPRFRLLLPLIALLDLLVSAFLCVTAYEKYAHPDPDKNGAKEAAQAAQRLAFWLMACAVFRTLVLAGVGFSKRTRSLGVLIAATCLLSVLFVMSIANMLLEAHALQSKRNVNGAGTRLYALRKAHVSHITVPELPLPVLPLFTGQQLLFTVLEWAAFIAVVGVRLPPGKNPVKARRWARTLRHHDAEGLDVRSLNEHLDHADLGSGGDSDDEDYAGEGMRHDLAHETRPQSPQSVRPYRARKAEDNETVSSSIRPIAPQSPHFPMGSPSPAPSFHAAQSQNQGQQRPSSVRSGPITPLRTSSTGAAFRDVMSPTDVSEEAGSSSAQIVPDLELQLDASGLSLPPSVASPDGADDMIDDDLEHDPQDIIDIPSDKRLSRQESKRRLAKAYARSNASSSSINALPGASGSANRRSFAGGRRDSTAASIRTTNSTSTNMGLPISTPSIPDRRTSTSFRAQSPPLVSNPATPTGATSPVARMRGGAGSQGLLKGKSGKLGIGIGLGRRPSWLGGPKRDGSSGSHSNNPSRPE